jgi:hypothetical protein
MLGGIAASSAALGLLNPAVAHGVRAWVWGTYVLGPVIGAVIGVNLYALLFADTTAVAATSSAASATRATATKKPVAKKKTTSRKKK